MAKEQCIIKSFVSSDNIPTIVDDDGVKHWHIICDSNELDSLEKRPVNDNRQLVWREKSGAEALPVNLKTAAAGHVFFGLANPSEVKTEVQLSEARTELLAAMGSVK